MNTASSVRSLPRGWLAFAGLLAVGGVLDVIVRTRAAELPPWLPWEFSWPVFLATFLSLGWYGRGLARLAAADHPPLWRSACFVLGVLLLYAMLQSKIDYLAQHMFFIHRAQHFVLHHIGAFLVALGFPGAVLRAGMPEFLKPAVLARPVQRTIDVLQHPIVAPVLFVGMIWFWLIPSIHTRVMLDWRLYDLMNWTMAADGILFWSLILDPRPSPPARIGSGLRAILVILVEPPQMVLGALLSFTETDWYDVYDICGRIWPVTAISDLHYGGLIIWLPGTFLSLAAILIVLVNMRLNEERAEALQPSP